MRVEHRSQSDTWQTPDIILDAVRKVDFIGLDPASTHENPTRAAWCFTPDEDGLGQHWSGKGLVFCNPPFSAVKAWAFKAISEGIKGEHREYAGERTEIILLVAARPGARWYRSLQLAANGYCEIKGRLKFVGAESSAPFPSAVFYFGERFPQFEEVFSSLGLVLTCQGRTRPSRSPRTAGT